MIFMLLTDDQRKDVHGVSRHAVGRVALHAQTVLLSDRGVSARPQISRSSTP